MGLLSRTQSATLQIGNGASVSSSALYLGNATLMLVELPDAWTAADIAFLVSDDGTKYGVLLNRSTGAPYVLKTGGYTAASSGVVSSIPAELALFVGVKYVKLKSVSEADPTVAVNQGGARVLKIVKGGV